MSEISPRAEFAAGLRGVAPLLIGVIPFGIIYGVVAAGTGMPLILAQLISLIVFAGSAQFACAQLIGAGASGLMIVTTAFVINLRHALYSASLEPYTLHLPSRWKWVLSYLLTDEAYAVAIRHYQSNAPLKNKHWHFFGAGIGLWSTWQVSTGAGILLGAHVPASWSLDFALALSFIAIVLPMLKTRADVAAALSAGAVALAAHALPYKLGLLLASFTGIAVGFLVSRDRA
jgi:4-azaleucine resistance transporter AzlC